MQLLIGSSAAWPRALPLPGADTKRLSDGADVRGFSTFICHSLLTLLSHLFTERAYSDPQPVSDVPTSPT